MWGRLSRLFNRNRVVEIPRSELEFAVRRFLPDHIQSVSSEVRPRDMQDVIKGWDEVTTWVDIAFDGDPQRSKYCYVLSYALKCIQGAIGRAEPDADVVQFSEKHWRYLVSSCEYLNDADDYLQMNDRIMKTEKGPTFEKEAYQVVGLAPKGMVVRDKGSEDADDDVSSSIVDFEKEKRERNSVSVMVQKGKMVVQCPPIPFWKRPGEDHAAYGRKLLGLRDDLEEIIKKYGISEASRAELNEVYIPPIKPTPENPDPQQHVGPHF